MKKTILLRWLFSIMIIAFWGFGTALAQDTGKYPDPNDKAAMAEEMDILLHHSDRFVENNSSGVRGCATSLDEGFEGAFPPAGWTIINSATASNDMFKTPTYAHTGTYSAVFSSYDYSSDFNQYLISPELVTIVGDQSLSFWYRQYAWGSEVFKVGWSSTGTDVVDFTWSAEIDNSSTTWQQYTKTDLPVGTKYVAIHYYSDYMYYLFVDDFLGPDLFYPATPYFVGGSLVDFGETYDLGVYEETYEISNCGTTDDLVVTLDVADPELAITGLPATIAPGGSVSLTVTFTPGVGNTGAYSGSFDLTTTDPGNLAVTVNVYSDVEEAVITTTLFQDFEAIAGYNVPTDWISTFSARTSGGVDDSHRFTDNLYGTTSLTGQFLTNFTVLANNSKFLFDYRAAEYYYTTATTPEAADAFTFTVYISDDYGVTYTPIYVYDETTHVETLVYANVEIDLAAYIGDTVQFAVDAEAFAGNSTDMNLDFDNFGVLAGAPGFVINNPVLDMGDRPIEAWMKPATYEIVNNPPGEPFVITQADIDNNFDGFLTVDTPTLPYTLDVGVTTHDFAISTTEDSVAEGAFDGNFAVFYGEARAIAHATYMGNAYLPDEGDVWELAFDASTIFPGAVTVPQGTFRNNYDLPGVIPDGWDVVYMVETDADALFTATLTATDAKMVIYPDGFGGVGGPDMENGLFPPTTSFVDIELVEGIYYLVVSTTGTDYTLDMNGVLMPAPAAATYIAPENFATGIINGDSLKWAFGANTIDYQVTLGITTPPTNVVVEWTDDLADFYKLVNTVPNLQYFWQVNTANSNDTTDGAIWVFTSEITPPSGLMVTLNDLGESIPTVSTSLIWDAPLTRAFLGYNVYRDGVKLNVDLLITETYEDLVLARNMPYKYYVKAEFDQGESGPSNDTTVTALGVGTFDGVVTDAITGDSIEDASVTISSDAFTYALTTDSLGQYTTLAYTGIYGIDVTKSTYFPGGASGVALTHGATVTTDFALSEMPLPVGYVLAEETNDDEVHVSWGDAIPPTPFNVWISYDDGVNYGGLAWTSGNPMTVASRWTTDSLAAYAGNSLSRISIFLYEDIPLTTGIELAIWTGTAHTLVQFQTVTGALVPDAWNEFILDTPFLITGDEEIMFGFTASNYGAGHPCAYDVGPAVVDRGDMLYNAGWMQLSSFGSDYDRNWNIKGFVTNFVTRNTLPLVAVENSVHYFQSFKSGNTEPETIDMSDEINTSASAKFPAYVTENTRGIVSYDVWRNKVYQPETAVLVGNTIQQDFVDFDWGIQEWGVYQWSVVVNYTAGQSEHTYSNTLETDMEILVSALVNTNSGDSPLGTTVTFTNMSELDPMGEPIYIYTATLDDAGFTSWADFRRGTYDIDVSLMGFTPINEDGVDIFDDTDFEWMLEEIIAIPRNLYVTPTGYATWEGAAGGGGAFEPYFSDFEADNGGWISGGTLDSWEWGAPADDPITFAYSGSKVWMTGLAANYSASSDFWLQRRFDFTDAANPHISLQLFMYCEAGFDGMALEYSTDDGATWAKIAQDLDPQTFYNNTATWGPITPPKWGGHSISDYQLVETFMPEVAGMSNVLLRFHFGSDSSVQYEGFAIDDVTVSDATRNSKSSRAFEAYKVFLDGELITEITDAEYQYGTEGEILLPDSTYTAGVAGVFTMGQSETAEFVWTYIPCDRYAAPTEFSAAQVEGTMDIKLEWTNAPVAALDSVDYVTIYRDGVFYDTVSFATSYASTFTDGPLEFGTYSYCITYIYDDGAETCQGLCAEADLVGTAAVDGFVFQYAYLGGAPIEGAEVYLVDITDPTLEFSYTTDIDGAYGGEILAGTYNYIVSARGYITETLDSVLIPLNGTVSKTFELDEFPLPPLDVIATEITDDEVLITWHSPMIPFVPALYDFESGANDWEIQGNVNGWQWGDATTLSSSFVDFSGNATNFIAVNADAAGSGGSSIVVNATSPSQDFASASEVFVVFDYFLKYDALAIYYSIDGGTPVLIENLATSTGWIEAYMVEVPVAALEASVQIIFKYSESGTWGYGAAVDNVVITDAVAKSGEPVLTAYQPTRDMTGYEIYRTTCQTGDLTFMGMVPPTDTVFTDHTWGEAVPNVYKWGVIAIYENNDSEIAYSNCLDKNMITDVTVTVTTNSGDLPTGTFVEFTNMSEPELGLTYIALLDETGYFAWDNFRLGDYDIFVEKPGFTPIEIVGEPIWEATDFTWLLEEEITPVGELHVTPTAFATWTGEAPPPPPPTPTIIIDENFDSYTVGDFVAEVSPVFTTWSNAPGGSEDAYITDLHSASPVNSVEVVLNNDLVLIMDDYTTGIYTYEMKMYIPTGYAGYFNLQKTSTPGDEWAFQIYYQTDGIANGDAGVADAINHPFNHDEWMDIKVEVNLDTDWATYYFNGVEIIGYQWTLGTFGTPGLLQFGGANIFGGVEAGSTDTPLFYIDDFVLSQPPETTTASRELQYYKVWLDEIFVEDVMENHYQYDITNLVQGQEYFSEVAAMYTNGMSEKMDYTWTYMPCDSFPGPTDLAGELQDVNDVLLTWSTDGSVTPPPMELVEITQNPGAPVNGYYQSYDYGYGVVYDLSDYPDALANSIEFYHASWGTAGPHNYNIHIIDWTTEATISILGPFTTTGDDQWELDIDLGDINLMGATDVAFLMEPLSNSATDAYPDLSSDDAVNPQGSVFGPLDDVASIGASEIGNWLMNIFIMTSNGTKVMAPRSLDLPVAVNAIPRIGGNNTSVASVIDNQTANVIPNAEYLRTSMPNPNVEYSPMQRDIEINSYSRATWDLQFNFPTNVHPPANTGAESDGEFIYTTDWQGGNFMKYALDGTLLETFTCGTASAIRDLAYCPTTGYFYGAAANTTLYIMDFATHTVIGTVTAPTACRAIAYNDDNDSFYANNWSSDITEFDRETGALIGSFTCGPVGASYYGLAYDKWTDGGPFLWGFAQIGNLGTLVQIHLPDGVETGFVYDIMPIVGAPAGSMAGGLFTTPDLVSGTVTIGGCVQNELLFGFELDVTGGGGGGGNAGPSIGANVYRDGVMIAEMVQDTFYLDMALDYGMYEYCVNLVYEDFAESCSGSCVDVEVTEDCVAPEDLTATLEGDNLVHLLWDQAIPVGEWLSYGDGVYADAIGLTDFSPITVAVQWDPTDLANFDGNVFSKVKFYYGTGSVGDVTAQIWEGTTLVMEQAVTTTIVGESWNEVILSSPVVIDATKSYRIGYTVANYDAYPCGAQNYTGEPNSDLVLLNGVWDHINNYLPYSWMLETYVSSVTSAAVNAPVESTVLSHNGTGTLVSSPVPVDVSRTNVGRSNNTRSFVGYNIYNNGDLLEALWPDNFYDYDEMQSGHQCYTVTAEYSYCGESAHSNEACVDIYVGIDEIGENEVSLYPNPASNQVNVTSIHEMTRLTVINYVGQVVYTKDVSTTRVELNTNSYQAGVYLVKIETESGVITKRFIIRR